jgi:hypothetical protein
LTVEFFNKKMTEDNSYEERKIQQRPNHGDLAPGQDWGACISGTPRAPFDIKPAKPKAA